MTLPAPPGAEPSRRAGDEAEARERLREVVRNHRGLENGAGRERHLESVRDTVVRRSNEHEPGEAHVGHGPRGRADVSRLARFNENDRDLLQHAATP